MNTSRAGSNMPCFGLHKLIDRPTTYATMLRYPLERVTSSYWHLKTWRGHFNNRLAPKDAGFTLDSKASLDEFIHKYRLRELDNDQTRRIAGVGPEFGGCTRSLLESKVKYTAAFFVSGHR
jgi:hypothetical protein